MVPMHCKEYQTLMVLSVSVVFVFVSTPSSVGAWALKRIMSPGALTKGGVGIRRTKRDASACP